MEYYSVIKMEITTTDAQEIIEKSQKLHGNKLEKLDTGLYNFEFLLFYYIL
jgi:hypothetical protein